MTTDEEIIKLRQLATLMMIDCYNERFTIIETEVDSIMYSVTKTLDELRILYDPSDIKKDIIDLICMALKSDLSVIGRRNDNK